MNSNEVMTITLNKEQYDALYTLFNNISVGTEDENENIYYAGKTCKRELTNLTSIGNQIFQNNALKRNIELNLHKHYTCKECKFIQRIVLKKGGIKFYCMKKKAKNTSSTGFAPIHAKDESCIQFESIHEY